MVALTGSTAGLHWWVALVGSTGEWAQVGGTGCTGGWHWWAQVGWHRWVALLGTGRVAQVGALLGTGGHRWVICWAQVGGTCGWHCW
ncbi:unnamed protein product, partial [Staurois parvus]